MWPDVVARNVTRLRAAEKAAPLDFVLYGDSITAALWGYEVSSKAPGAQAVWEAHFGDKRAVALGIAGDQIGNVLWRVVQHERPATDPKVIGLHIGINDLIGWGSGGKDPVPPTLERLRVLIRTVAGMFPMSVVVVLALTPCNGLQLRRKRQAHNAAVQKMVESLAKTGVRTAYVDAAATAGIVADNGGPSASGILADGVHLTPAGHDKHLRALRSILNAFFEADPRP
jgi:lysophospholipase L1-like esterase